MATHYTRRHGDWHGRGQEAALRLRQAGLPCQCSHKKMPMAWTVYLIRTQRGHLYTGISTDPQRRLREHREDPGGRGAKYFRFDRPLAIVYEEPCQGRAEALRREREIKRLPKRGKEALLQALAAH
jgi:putative endonuclease